MNSFINLSDFFSTPKKPVETKEFVDFWASCSMKERKYFRHVDLKTGLMPEGLKLELEWMRP